MASLVSTTRVPWVSGEQFGTKKRWDTLLQIMAPNSFLMVSLEPDKHCCGTRNTHTWIWTSNVPNVKTPSDIFLCLGLHRQVSLTAPCSSEFPQHSTALLCSRHTWLNFRLVESHMFGEKKALKWSEQTGAHPGPGLAGFEARINPSLGHKVEMFINTKACFYLLLFNLQSINYRAYIFKQFVKQFAFQYISIKTHHFLLACSVRDSGLDICEV